jgi:hypothetical protein
MYKILSQKLLLVKIAVVAIALLPGIIAAVVMLQSMFTLNLLDNIVGGGAIDPQVKALEDALLKLEGSL